MVIKDVKLDIVCGATSKLPQTGKSQIAFAGRSNVGKSTLINAIINRKSLARTSSSPGKTQTINFYLVNDSFYLVDLPGYGYAKVSAKERDNWKRMIDNYLYSSKGLKAVVMLVDIRIKPTENDIKMKQWITDRGFTPIIVVTKADKIKRSQTDKQLKVIRDTLEIPDSELFLFSGKTKQGLEEIGKKLSSILEGE